MNYLGKVIAIVWKDILTELRTKEMLSSMLVFSLMVVVIFNFVFEPGSLAVRETTAGILWVAFTFAGVLGLNRSFIYEVDRGCLQGLMLCPVDHSAIYLGKVVGNLIFMTVMEAITWPVFAVFFNLSLLNPLPKLIPVALLSTFGFAAVGTLFSAIAVNTKTREVMLPVLLFPVAVPVIIHAVESTRAIFEGKPWRVITDSFLTLGAFDVIFLVLAILTFEYIIQE